MTSLSGPSPYFSFPGTAREALAFYQGVFGGEVRLNTYGEFGRTDGPAEAVAHGMLVGGVPLFASDAAEGEKPFSAEGLLFSLLGAEEPATLRTWFEALSEGGTVVDPLQERPWGASDGIVKDRYGVTWLIGFEG